MKKLLSMFALSLACSFQASAGGCFSDECVYDCYGRTLDIIYDVGVGYRNDELDWAYAGTSPGLSIHENWKDVNIGYIQANTRITNCKQYILKFGFDYGWAGSQTNHHVKLNDHNSEEVTTLSKKMSSTAQVYDLTLGFGYKYTVECFEGADLMFAPFVGWSYSHQRFRNASYYNSDKFASTYYWTSPWIGFETSFKMCAPWTVYMSYSFHPGSFHSKVDELFRSHKHHERSYGNEVELGTGYLTCQGYWLGLNFIYKNYWTDSYHAAYEVTNGSHKHITRWNSYSIGLDVGYIY